MKKLEIKNQIVSVFNSVDSTTLNSKGEGWYVWLGNSVKVIEKYYKKMPKEDLLGCLHFANMFVEDSKSLTK